MARIAIGGFQHETNTFAPAPADWAAFNRGGAWPPLVSGADLMDAMQGVNISIAGFIAEAAERGHELVPTSWAAATPSAQVTEDAYERIAGLVLAGIEKALPVDAVYLCLHGAMVAEHLEDGEGELLRRVRALIGPAIPLVASLDLHSNTTRLMVDSATALVAYKTYPHVDMADTGRRTARLLDRVLRGARLAKAYRQLPFLIPLTTQCTLMEPAEGVYALRDELEAGEVASVSFTPGFPAADIADCGPAAFAYGTSPEAAERAADRLARMVAEREPAFLCELLTPEQGVRRAMQIAGAASRPVVIADTQDNPGAGGNSDTTGMLRALVALDAPAAALGLMADEESARIAHQAGEGAEVTIALGGKSGVPGDEPFRAPFTVERLSDGAFLATGPFYGGARMQLGPSACLRIRDVRVVVASRKVQMADQAMYRFVGVEPTRQKILVNKSSVHFRADFQPIAEQVLVCAAPGPMIADPALLPWSRLRRGVRTRPMGQPFGG